MSKYAAKAALRQAKNLTFGYTDIQVKVREATSNDPWGPSGVQMTEIADSTYRPSEFNEIMEMIDKRLNDSGKNWRHVFKALTLLDYLIHCGSESVIAYAKQNLYIIKTLKEFQFVDEEGKDQGVNVREKSKAIVSLLADDERLKEERKQRQSLRERMQGPQSTTSRVAPATAYDEELQLQRAIEQSKREAMEIERRAREREREDRDLQKAIEVSKQEQQQQTTARQQSQAIDLWGAGSGGKDDQAKHDLDFFSSLAAPAPVQSSQPDPFGFGGGQQQQQHQQQAQFGAFGSSSGGNAFAASTAFSPQTAGGFAAQNPAFAASAPAFQPIQGQFGGGFGGGGGGGGFGQPQMQLQQQSAFSAQPANNGGFGGAFDSAFDTGAGQRNLVPRHLQGQSNPNAQLAQIARNATQIDPFAKLASQDNLYAQPVAAPQTMMASGWTSPPPQMQPMGGLAPLQPTTTSLGSNPFATMSAPTQPKPVASADPFASLSPFPKGSTANAAPKNSLAASGSTGGSQHFGQFGFNPQQQQQQQQQAPFGMQPMQPQQQPFGGSQQKPPSFQQQPSQQNFFF